MAKLSRFDLVRYAATVLVVLVSCSGVQKPRLDGASSPVRDAYYSGFPRPSILASKGLSQCNKAAIAAAAAWWSQLLYEHIEIDWTDADNPYLGLPPQGVISVVEGLLFRPGTYATSIIYRTDDRMHSAEIRLGRTCRVRAAAHELGHALGWIEHAPEPGWLMSDPYETTTWRH